VTSWRFLKGVDGLEIGRRELSIHTRGRHGFGYAEKRCPVLENKIQAGCPRAKRGPPCDQVNFHYFIFGMRC
jgi:hypothetical protein